MELSDFIEFKQLKNVKVAFHFQIELKEFKAFKKTFLTDKYLTVTQWEEITRQLTAIAKKKIKASPTISDQDAENENQFEVDGSFRVKYKFLPKEETYIDFQKLKFTYELDWILTIEILRLSLIIEKAKKGTLKVCEIPKHSSISDISEYDPTVNQPYLPLNGTPQKLSPIFETQEYEPSPPTPRYGVRKTRYTPTSKNTAEHKAPAGYSPRSLNNSFTAQSSKYTPTKIEKNLEEVPSSEPEVSKRTYTWNELFGDDPESDYNDEEKNKNKAEQGDEVTDLASAEKYQQSMKSRCRKRHLKLPEESKKSDDKSSKTLRSHKKVKITATPTEMSSTLDVWLTSSKASSETPSKVTQRCKPKRKKEKEPSSEHRNNIDDDTYQKMNDFLRKAKQDEEVEDKRRLELEAYEMLNCNDLTNADLKKHVKEFTPIIKQHLDKQNVTSSRNSKYDPVIFTTSNILSEKQCEYVLQQIEKQRDVCDRGQNEEIIIDRILPEFIVYVFCNKFNMSKEEALGRVALQEERRALNCNDSIL